MIKIYIIPLFLLLNSYESAAAVVLQPPVKLEQPISYINKTYHFSFTIPVGWKKQTGQANADNVLFMSLPISQSCSFQFNVIAMPATFPAEAAVNNAVALAHHDVRLNKLSLVKRRDTVLKEKFKEKGKEKEKLVILTRGWEITEKSQQQKQQHIIYQAYDRQNRYFNFVATATSEKFASCVVQLHKIIDSISFTPV